MTRVIGKAALVFVLSVCGWFLLFAAFQAAKIQGLQAAMLSTMLVLLILSMLAFFVLWRRQGSAFRRDAAQLPLQGRLHRTAPTARTMLPDDYNFPEKGKLTKGIRERDDEVADFVALDTSSRNGTTRLIRPETPPELSVTARIERPAPAPHIDPPRREPEIEEAAPSSEAAELQPVEPDWDTLAPAELHRLLNSKHAEVSELVTVVKTELAKIDSCMMKHLSSNTTNSIHSVVDLRRILTALERRLKNLDDELVHGVLNPAHVRELVSGDLLMEEDSLTSLISSKPLPPLKPEEWKPTISALFRKILRRKDVFKGAKISIPF